MFLHIYAYTIIYLFTFNKTSVVPPVSLSIRGSFCHINSVEKFDDIADVLVETADSSPLVTVPRDLDLKIRVFVRFPRLYPLPLLLPGF